MHPRNSGHRHKKKADIFSLTEMNVLFSLIVTFQYSVQKSIISNNVDFLKISFTFDSQNSENLF